MEEICDKVEKKICKEVKQCDVFVYVEPEYKKQDIKQKLLSKNIKYHV
jgi:divalent metal cation (Fe/Co/Zn/Cd) transporter